MTQANPYQIGVTVRLRGTQPVFEFAATAPEFFNVQDALLYRSAQAVVLETVEEIERTVAEFSPARTLYQHTARYRVTRSGTLPAATCRGLLFVSWQEKTARQAQITRRGFGYDQSEAVDYLDLLLQPTVDKGQRFQIEVHAPLQHVAIADRRTSRFYDPATLFDRAALRSLRHPDFAFRADINAIVTDIGGWPRAAAALFLRQRRRNPAYTVDEAWRTLEKLGSLGRLYVK